MTFDWEGVTLHYVLEGSGPVLLLLHGLGGNAENWLLQRRHLSATHRVLSLDLPGHGRSAGRSVAFQDYWLAVEATLDHAGVERAVVCGLAAGGSTGIALAARRPDRVGGLIIVNAYAHFEPDDQAKRLALYDILLEDGGPERWAEQLLELMHVEQYPAIVRGFRKSLEHVDPIHLNRICHEQMGWDQRGDLPHIACPALFVSGSQDLLVPAYCIDEMLAGLARGALAIMDTGHLPYLEAPAEFNRIVDGFLDQNRL
jgi:sigma-B regulation protein RsbQ